MKLLLTQCEELEAYIIQTLIKNKIKDMPHFVIPNNEHSTNLISNNNN